MEYHPGGEDELMKAAGADGTDLFDQVKIPSGPGSMETESKNCAPHKKNSYSIASFLEFQIMHFTERGPILIMKITFE